MTDASEVVVATCQFLPGKDPAENLRAVATWVDRAAKQGANLVVFPEYTSYFSGRLDKRVREHAEDLTGPFVSALSGLARARGIHVVAGMFEALAGTEKVSNTLVALGPTGDLVAVYRKQHLYDAFGVRESEWVAPGTVVAEPAVFEVGGLTAGMQTCYDVRFPEVSRTLVDAGAHLLLVPADWVPGARKTEHWRTLLAARAIENTVYVAAADHPRPTGVGASTIIDPSGIVLTESNDRVQELAVATVSATTVNDVRQTNPVVATRRYRVVPA